MLTKKQLLKRQSTLTLARQLVGLLELPANRQAPDEIIFTQIDLIKSRMEGP